MPTQLSLGVCPRDLVSCHRAGLKDDVNTSSPRRASTHSVLWMRSMEYLAIARVSVNYVPPSFRTHSMGLTKKSA
jgi:hypothetical protein